MIQMPVMPEFVAFTLNDLTDLNLHLRRRYMILRQTRPECLRFFDYSHIHLLGMDLVF